MFLLGGFRFQRLDLKGLGLGVYGLIRDVTGKAASAPHGFVQVAIGCKGCFASVKLVRVLSYTDRAWSFGEGLRCMA